MLYAYKSRDLESNGRNNKLIHGAKLHRAKSESRYSSFQKRRYTTGFFAICEETKRYSNTVTTGQWSFRAPKDWTPDTPINELEAAFEFLARGKSIPVWAYEAEVCMKCFPEYSTKVKCNLGHSHKMSKKEAMERGLVDGDTRIGTNGKLRVDARSKSPSGNQGRANPLWGDIADMASNGMAKP